MVQPILLNCLGRDGVKWSVYIGRGMPLDAFKLSAEQAEENLARVAFSDGSSIFCVQITDQSSGDLNNLQAYSMSTAWNEQHFNAATMKFANSALADCFLLRLANGEIRVLLSLRSSLRRCHSN